MHKTWVIFSLILYGTHSQECGTTLQSAELRLKNPEYPNLLIPGISCDWIVRTISSGICKLEVEYVFADLQDSTLVIAGVPLTGSLAGLQTFYFQTNTTISFRSGNLPGRGFDIILRQKLCPVTPTACGSTITDVETTINGPNLMNDCTYLIKQEKRSFCEVKIKFSNFYLENTPNCIDNRLEIGDDVLCGNIIGERLYPFSNGKLTIRYRLNEKSKLNNFSLKLSQIACTEKVEDFDGEYHYNITKSPSNFLYNYMPYSRTDVNFGTCCNGIHSERRFLLASPGFPYSNNVDCTYTIGRYSPSTQYLQLKFRYFWIGDQDLYYGCNGGSLEIDGTPFCGCQTGLIWNTWFNVYGYSDYKIIRLTINQPNRNRFVGFVIEVLQCDFPDPPYRYRRSLNSLLEQFKNDNFTDVKKDNITNSVNKTLSSAIRDGKSKPFERFGVLPDIRCISWNLNNWLLLLQEAVITQLQCPTQSQFISATSEPTQYYKNNEANCTEYRTDQGFIQAPPFYSSSLRECFRVYQLPGRCFLQVIFHEFNLHASEGCTEDFVYISGIGRICQLPPTNNTVNTDLKNSYVDIIIHLRTEIKQPRMILEFRQLPCSRVPR